jgi:hypothetical protein
VAPFRMPLVALSLVAIALAGCTTPAPGGDNAPPDATPDAPPASTPPSPPAETNAGPPRTATVTSAAGGNLQSADGRLGLEFPPGAVAADTAVTVSVLPRSRWPAAAEAAGAIAVVRLEPDGLSFPKPVAVLWTANATDVPALNASGGAPALALYTVGGSGRAEPLAGTETSIDGTTVRVQGTTTHFSDLVIARIGVTVAIDPAEVIAFVGDPPFVATLRFFIDSNDTTLTLGDFRPIADGPLRAIRATAQEGGLNREGGRVNYVFECVAQGTDVYLAHFSADWRSDTGLAHIEASQAGIGRCLKRPVLNATLTPPRTVFDVGNAEPDDDYPPGKYPYLPARVNYAWFADISCGVFNASGDMTVNSDDVAFEHGGPQASWSHPNLDPDEPAADDNGDDIPDACEHSETPSFSHRGTITVELSYYVAVQTKETFDVLFAGTTAQHDPFLEGNAYCRYAGSLAGKGECFIGKLFSF